MKGIGRDYMRRFNIKNNTYDHRFTAVRVLTNEEAERRAVALLSEHHFPLVGYSEERAAVPLTMTVHPSYIAQYARRKAVTA
jgi:hypothetical protein